MGKNAAPLGQLERRALPLDLAAVELRQAEGEGEGERPRGVAWYPALFEALSEDLGGWRERLGRRAFTKSLQGREVRSLVNHDPSLILGRSGNGSLKLAVDLRGLRAETMLPETSYAADLIANLRNGNISGGSFMFRALDDKWDMEAVEGSEEPVLVRTVREAELYDVSLVTFPAYPATEGSASLRSLAVEWRQRLTAGSESPVAPPVERRQMDMCAAVRGMCSNCEASDCEMKDKMAMDGGRSDPALQIARDCRRRALRLVELKAR